ncbi:hypothetical protein [Priestia koreensis]|uniref:hypothetical protein n=1 Tax=Priestia koreensis TaxID=284581 RepID=UPI0034585560
MKALVKSPLHGYPVDMEILSGRFRAVALRQTLKIITEVSNMDLVEIRQELEKTAKRLADFRGSL